MRAATYVVLLAVTFAGCVSKPAKKVDPCDPNPCEETNKTACVNENAEARCLCDLHFVLRPSGVCEELSLSNCPEHGGDTAEPDDCLARARPVTPTDPPRNQSVDPTGDYDFFKLDAANRHVYTVTVKAAGAQLLPRVDVFDQGGVWLLATDELGQATLSFKARYGGLHYVRVSHSPFDPSVATGDYTVSVSSTGTEDHGDGPSEATSVTPSVVNATTTPPSLTGRFEVANDQDWFSFNATSGTSYNLSFNPARLQPILALYSDGDPTQPIWTNEQADNPFNVTSSGRYYLVTYPPATAGTTNTYEFQFTRSN